MHVRPVIVPNGMLQTSLGLADWESILTASKEEPSTTPVLHEHNENVLFLHWIADPGELQKALPAGVTVDPYGATAYVGLCLACKQVRLRSGSSPEWFTARF